MSGKINIKNYFDDRIFIIPQYQRGYKWSLKENGKESSLEYFIQGLIAAFENDLTEYFIEAVTVVEEDRPNSGDKRIVLVDGQQRTTSLYLLFIALHNQDFVRDKLYYSIREDSHRWLNNLTEQKEFIEDEDMQDIYYFKEAQTQIEEKLELIRDRHAFLNFIKERVFLLYNLIPREKAVNTFVSLNGLKAIMKDEELIKSQLLIQSSIIVGQYSENEMPNIEWTINEDRGRLARNWDKWLYWWNREEVKNYYGTGDKHPLYYLLITYWNVNQDAKGNEFSFDNFKNKFINTVQNAKIHFEGLRKLHKTFEDLYNNYSSHNFLGLILKTSDMREVALHYFFDSKKEVKTHIEQYAKLSLVDITHAEIINNAAEEIVKKENILNKVQNVLQLISEKNVYWDDNDKEFDDKRKEYSFRFLLLLNLLEDNKLKRKFDFSIWSKRSLEHIYPKSKKDLLNFDPNFSGVSIHCIGNLVLLYGRDNSVFGAKEFSEKKNTYFDTSTDFKSRNLLHTISVFSNSDWKEKEISENKKKILKLLSSYYGVHIK